MLEFEATSRALLARVDAAIEDLFFNHEMVRSEEWRRESFSLDGE